MAAVSGSQQRCHPAEKILGIFNHRLPGQEALNMYSRPFSSGNGFDHQTASGDGVAADEDPRPVCHEGVFVALQIVPAVEG